MKSILYARISDNIFDPVDWPVRRLIIEGEKIVDHSDLPMKGFPHARFGYGAPCTGWTLDELLAWAAVDNTGKHPEICHDIKAEGDERYEPYVSSRERLDEVIKRGRRRS